MYALQEHMMIAQFEVPFPKFDSNIKASPQIERAYTTHHFVI